MAGESYGWRMENIVFLELLRRCRRRCFDLYYYHKEYEIDFVVCDGNKVMELIQVSMDISKPKTRRREVNNLTKSSKTLHCSHLTLITREQEETINIDSCTIQVIPIIDWILKDDTAYHCDSW